MKVLKSVITFLLFFNCSNSTKKDYHFNMYDISANENIKSYFFSHKPYINIKGTKSRKTITLKTKKCHFTETYTLNDKNIWSSKNEIKGTTKGKLITNYEKTYKYVYNDTVLIYFDSGVKLKLDYNPKFNFIKIQTKNSELIFNFPHFNSKKEKLNRTDIDSLLNRNDSYLEIKKMSLGKDFYKDIVVKDSLKNIKNKYTLYYKLNGLPEYFISLNKCLPIEPEKLEYLERK